jgi:hypothetical protein
MIENSTNSGKKLLFLLEEHHEAFFAWHYAKNLNLISEVNSLLHFDFHPDMTLPYLRTSIYNLNNSLPDINNFTYSEIGIGNFIYPAIAQRLINRMYWFFPESLRFQKMKNDLYVSTYNSEGKIFLSSIYPPNPMQDRQSLDKIHFEMFFSLLDDEFKDDQNLILDIDLDYFSCELYNKKTNDKIEISANEYFNFINDKYHFLRITGNYRAAEIDNKYYLFPNTTMGFQVDTGEIVSETEIIKRIDRLCNFLVNQNINPSIIDISRSEISGFTPKSQCNFIMENLIKELKDIYPIDIVNINDITD